MTDSSTGGYLTPQLPPAPTPIDGEQLEDFFHDLFVGITGLDPKLVRPRWQEESTNIPDAGTVWLAFGFVDEKSDFSPAVIHNADGEGNDQLQRHEEFSVECSFYGLGAGSAARATAKLLRDGLSIAQNREVFRTQGMGLIEVTAPTPAPILIKTRWQYRCDMSVRVRRCVTRNYNVLNLKSAGGQIDIQTSQPTELVETLKVQNT